MAELPNLTDWLVERATNRVLTTSWVLNIFFLTVALLGTWKFLPILVTDFTIGVFILVGGIQMIFETVYEGEWNPREDYSDLAGFITAMFALLYGSGLTDIGSVVGLSNEFLTTHFGGVQGGVLLTLLLMLIYEGVFNRT